jgi:predicted nucleic acid-binding protein
MRVFIDANVLISTLNREYPLFTWSARVKSLHGKQNIRLFTSPLCLAIAFYFSGQKDGEIIAKKKLELLCQHIEITTMDGKITIRAIQNPNIHDFEDGLEYYSALQNQCNLIITENNEDFYFSEIETLNCQEFLQRLHRNFSIPMPS